MTDNNKPTFWFDMDGVLAKYNRADYEGENPEWLSNPNYFSERPKDKKAILVLKSLTETFDCYIISSVGIANSNDYNRNQIQAKLHWLRDIFATYHFDIPMTNIHFVEFGNKKSDIAEFFLQRPLSISDILIDDNNLNLLSWNKLGGTGFKYGNGVNDILTWGGHCSDEHDSSDMIINHLKQMVGNYHYQILDRQWNKLRDEIYDSYQEALEQFADYWRDIAFSDWLDNFDFEDYKKRNGLPTDYQFSAEEEDRIVEADLKAMTDKEIFDFFEFEVVKVEG